MTRAALIRSLFLSLSLIALLPLAPHTALASEADGTNGHYEWQQDWVCVDEYYSLTQDMWIQDCNWGPEYQVWYDDPPPPPPPDPPAPIEPLQQNASIDYLQGNATVCFGWQEFSGYSGTTCVTVSATQAAQYMTDAINHANAVQADNGSCRGGGDCTLPPLPDPIVTYDEHGRIVYVTCGNGAVLTATYQNVEACTQTNACGQSNTGTSIDGGACSVSAPPNPSGYGDSCNSTPNACGQTGSGTIQCNGSCSASIPAAPANLGQACTSNPNACGTTNSGTYQCDGSCSASTPANPAGYGTSCAPANSCGMSNSGTIQCNGSCSASAPSESLCNQPPSAPQLWGLYESATATYYGTSAPGYHAPGYAEYANSVDPNGDAVDYLFYFYNTQTGAYTTVDWSGWVSSGSWNYVTGLAGLTPGTYYVGAYAMDTHSAYSPFSGWVTLTLTAPTVNVSCTGTPASGTVSDTYSWSAATATGGNGGPYTYSWSGTNLGGKSGQSTTATYASGGIYSGSVTASDSVGNSSGATTCSVSSGGGGVSVDYVPTVGLTATPDTINPGHSSTLTWSSTHATSCTFTDESSPRGTSGTRVVSPNTTATYGITCTGSGGSATAYADVTVIQPAAYITAAPVRVAAGTPTQLSWSATHVNSCTVSGTDGYNWSSGSVSSVATTTAPRTITAQTTYTITCTTLSTPVTGSVVVNVLPDFSEF
jgi:hypothetical protein